LNSEIDQYWMSRALHLAKKAAIRGEVPVGAVLLSPLKKGQDPMSRERVVSFAGNEKEQLTTVLGHAEILCLHRAAKKQKAWRMIGCELYVTLEPCVMCAGAIQQARVSRVIYGASDPKGGAVDSLFRVLDDQRLNHSCEVVSGVMGDACGTVLRDFFRARRGRG
jgi:tRNA(adenine34) deaminase